MEDMKMAREGEKEEIKEKIVISESNKFLKKYHVFHVILPW